VSGFDDAFEVHYGHGLERDRLSTWARLEYVRTLELLDRFLPAPPARVLDVGGGPGAYAIALTERGYDVALVDAVELHVEQARAAGVGDATVGDARALASGDESADAVLLLGPLYHLTEAGDRARALSEVRRVLRPGGVVAAAAISRFASAIDGIGRGMLDDAEFAAMVDRDLDTGVHVNPDPAGRPEWFTTAYFHEPDELRAELTAAGFDDVDVLAVEGIASAVPRADPHDERLLALLRRLEREPALLGATAHLLAVGTAPPATARGAATPAPGAP
jgi:SAM-dependent methyltransferase